MSEKCEGLECYYLKSVRGEGVELNLRTLTERMNRKYTHDVDYAQRNNNVDAYGGVVVELKRGVTSLNHEDVVANKSIIGVNTWVAFVAGKAGWIYEGIEFRKINDVIKGVAGYKFRFVDGGFSGCFSTQKELVKFIGGEKEGAVYMLDKEGKGSLLGVYQHVVYEEDTRRTYVSRHLNEHEVNFYWFAIDRQPVA